MEKLNVGVMGCGRISSIYLKNLTQVFTHCVDVRAVADILPTAAAAQAEAYGVPKTCTPDELYADPKIDLIVNLTVPAAHYEVTKQALLAGKHVYTEKPLAITREAGQELVNLAQCKGLRLGGAPDTFMGAGLQTCRKLLDDGWVGQPLMAQAIIVMGVRSARYHSRGIGPIFDMSPYYITGLVSLLGPIVRVSGSAVTPFPNRTIDDPSSPEFGTTFETETPTVVSSTLDFANGVVANLTATCEVFGYNPRLEIYGPQGILTCNDPNMFNKPVLIRRRGSESMVVPYTHGFSENSRGLGVADMAYAIQEGRQHRASAELIYHVLDVMQAIHEASATGQAQRIASTVDRPAPLAPGEGTNPLALAG